jgi:hypothetical protein
LEFFILSQILPSLEMAECAVVEAEEAAVA